MLASRCSKCNEPLRKTRTEEGPHYASIDCPRCGFVRWPPNPFPDGVHLGELDKVCECWHDKTKDGEEYIQGIDKQGIGYVLFKLKDAQPDGAKWQLYRKIGGAR